MKKSYILMSMNTPLDTTAWLFGKRFIEILCNQNISLVPQIIGNEERCKDQFVDIESCEPIWSPVAEIRSNGSVREFNEDFFWKRKNVIKSQGHIFHTAKVGSRGELMLGSITIKFQINRKFDWFNLIRELIAHVRPTYGMIHLFTEPELTPDRVHNDFQIGTASRRLAIGVPELAYMNFFGDGLAGGVNQKQLELEGGIVEEIGSGYLVCVGKNLFDIEDDFEAFSTKRKNLKSVFPTGVFLS